MSFHTAGVPVLHLFTGAHEAYHTPDDTPALLDVPGAARVNTTCCLKRDGMERSAWAHREAGPAPGDRDCALFTLHPSLSCF
ncbi:M28 family peptidase [Archangium violaceum]|uniref:M28 family peptidase n=1 Tax=Archangium violaceum TaxID=83451 RepID=UPI0019507C49|nr:M28 family peptidase [Archangium violaceum]